MSRRTALLAAAAVLLAAWLILGAPLSKVCPTERPLHCPTEDSCRPVYDPAGDRWRIVPADDDPTTTEAQP